METKLKAKSKQNKPNKMETELNRKSKQDKPNNGNKIKSNIQAE